MHNNSGLPGTAQPWGRSVDKRLTSLERRAGLTDAALTSGADADKTVLSNFTIGQNIANGVSGTLPLDWPAQVQYVSSTGLFEVTVGLSGLVMAGAVLGVSFESEEFPADIYSPFNIPKYGVVATSAKADVVWAPFSSSRSTVISTRPGIYKLNLYVLANTTATASAQAYIKECHLSVKAV